MIENKQMIIDHARHSMQKRLSLAAGIIIHDKKGRVLLQLRDNKKSIRYPNTWVIFGGGVEGKETPEDAIKRELIEELGIIIDEPKLFGYYVYNSIYKSVDGGFFQHIFRLEKEIRLNNTELKEGQRCCYFTKQEIKSLNLGFNMEEILNDFFRSREI